MAARIKRGWQDPVIRVGNLASQRAVMDVRDCVNAYYMLMQKFTPGESYNVGADNLFSMGELLDMMLDMTGLPRQFATRENVELLGLLKELGCDWSGVAFAIEWIQYYGERVGSEVFDTCRHVGRFELRGMDLRYTSFSL